MLGDNLSFELHVVDHTRNVTRCYAIDLALDFFGAVIVETRWVWIGATSQHKRVSFETIEAARRHVRAALLRRAATRRRIGVAYVLVRGEWLSYAPALPPPGVASC